MRHILLTILLALLCGGSLNMSNSIYDDNVMVVNQNKWRARAIFGARLWK